MTDLHKPLGQDQDTNPGRKIPPKLYGAAAILIALGVGYGIYQMRQSSTTVISLNDVKVEEVKQVEVVAQPQQPPEKPAEEAVSRPNPAIQKVPDELKPPVFKPQKTKSSKRTPGTPSLDLIENSEFGALPKVSNTGLRPLDAYSASVTSVGATRIAIVLGGLGVSQTGTKNAIKELPASVTLAFSPIGNSLQRWMQAARKDGHEVSLQIPMEPLGYPAIDPGRGTLVSNADQDKNAANLRWALGRMSNYPVVMNYLGANFTNNQKALRPILQEIKDRGLGWLDDGSAQASKSLDIAEEIRLPHVSGNFVVDAKNEPTQIAQKLKLLELFARKRGYAVGTATAFPKTVTQITKWIAEAEKRGIQIVPLSNLLRDYGR